MSGLHNWAKIMVFLLVPVKCESLKGLDSTGVGDRAWDVEQERQGVTPWFCPCCVVWPSVRQPVIKMHLEIVQGPDTGPGTEWVLHETL